MSRRGGLLFAMGAAFFYGLSAIAGKLAVGGGGSAIVLSFYRNAYSIPLLYAILKLRKTDLSLTKKDTISIAFMGLVGGFLAGSMLFVAYSYISVSLAVCLHFSFPVMVAFAYTVFFKARFSRTKMLALAISFSGIWFFLERQQEIHTMGVLTALLSAVFYAAYLITMDRRGLKEMDGLKLSYYCSISSTLWLGLYGWLAGKQFAGVMGDGAWTYILAMAVLISLLGNPMIVVAVKSVGPTVASIVGVLEPVVSVLLGVFLLKEPFGFRSVIGAVLVLSASVLLALEKEEEGQEVPGGDMEEVVR